MSKLSRVGLVTLFLLVGVGLFPGWGRTAMMNLSLGQLTAEADTIVQGTVTSQESAWDNSHTAIHTDVTIRVEEVMQGSAGGEVTFRVAGGTVGDIGMRTSNDPVFEDGEQVILFLSVEGARASLVGLKQGKYAVKSGTVTRDGQTMPVADFVDAINSPMAE